MFGSLSRTSPVHQGDEPSSVENFAVMSGVSICILLSSMRALIFDFAHDPLCQQKVIFFSNDTRFFQK